MSTVYGCHNRKPLKTEAVVPDGWSPVYDKPEYMAMARSPLLKRVPDEMSKDCRYTHTDLGQADAKCDGCKHRAGRTPVSS